MSHWFSEITYLDSKLAQLQENGETEFTTAAQVKSAILDAGMTVKEHFDMFHSTELTNPNPDFDTTEYINAKLETLDDSWTFESLQKAMIKASGSVYDHYIDFGAYETSAAGGHGINPSNAFDSELYLQEKVADLNKDGGNWTVDKLVDLLQELHLTPLDHFNQFAEKEGLHEHQVPEDELVPEQPIGTVDPGKTFTLTHGVDVINGTDGDDIVNGTSSALSSERSLESGDQIDGKDGDDTLNVDMHSNFNGFSGDGKMVNVETLNLDNTSNLSRSFSAKGATGIENINIDANDQNFTVSELAQTDLSVSINNEDAAKSLEIQYADKVADGDNDALNLTLNGVGTAKAKDVAEEALTVKSDGIEHLNIVANGDANIVELTEVGDAESISISGSADLKVNNVATDVTEVDAAAATGNLDINLSGATAQSVALGSGDDTLTLSKAAVDGTFAGGEGNDTVILHNLEGNVVEPTVTGFEHLVINGQDHDLTLAEQGVADLQDITIEGGIAATTTVTVAELNNSNLDLHLNGASTAGTLKFTSEAALNIDATTEGKTNVINAMIVDAQAASAIDLSVGEHVQYTGALKANSAKAFAATVAKGGTMSGQIDIASADNVNLDIDGTLSSAINAASATSFEIDLAKDASWSGADSLDSAENLNLTIDGAATAEVTAKSASSVDMTVGVTGNATGLTVTADKATDVTLDYHDAAANTQALKASSSFENLENLTVNSTHDVTFEGVTLGGKSDSVTIDASGVKGAVTAAVVDYTGTEEGAAVILNGSHLGSNNLTVGTDYNEINVTGGIQDDSVTLTYNVSGEGALSLDLGTISTGDTLELAAGNNDFTAYDVSLNGVDSITTGNATFNAADISGKTIHFGANLTAKGTNSADNIDLSHIAVTGTSEINGLEGNDTIIGTSSADTITGGKGADILTGGEGADTFVVSDVTNFGIDTIKDFAKGEDLLSFTENGTATFTPAATDVSTATTLDEAIGLAAAGDGGTNTAITWFQYDGSTYVVGDNTDGAYTAATDVVVKLQGTLDLSSLAADASDILA